MRFKNLSELKGYEAFSNYAICSDGKLMNIKKQTFLCGNKSGEHLKYTINGKFNGKRITKTVEAHKLVALAFIDGYFDGAVVDHIDSNAFNNDYSNLQYITQSENIRKRKKYKIKKNFVIAVNVIDGTKQLFDTIAQCCKALDISISSAYKVKRGYRKLVKNKTYKLYFVEK